MAFDDFKNPAPQRSRPFDELAAITTIRPVKDKSTGRIDGIVALIMALSRAMARAQFRSVYENRTFTILW